MVSITLSNYSCYLLLLFFTLESPQRLENEDRDNESATESVTGKLQHQRTHTYKLLLGHSICHHLSYFILNWHRGSPVSIFDVCQAKLKFHSCDLTAIQNLHFLKEILV